MRLQIAIDRVSVDEALKIIEQTRGHADIIEVGTSLIKDFGLAGSVGVIREKYPNQCILADIKTCDEGAYEFQKTYEAGGDIPTVMGSSSIATILACQKMAAEFKKEYMIDLLEVSDVKLESLKQEFKDAIFCVHLPSDLGGVGLKELVERRCGQLKGIKKIAAAGGITLDTIEIMKKAGIDIVIVGGAVTKANHIGEAAKQFAEALG